ncbi:MAG: glycine cleavage system protein GcvH [Sphaerochaetaceae bacterium]|nr:glycine cleavage system protein GcvH [Sphaerochaetaceae bacterium]NLY07371.1 glycine cleavage system protein GcvH [Spirochaetales bacterium]
MSKVIEGLKYSKDHEWVKIEGTTATVGITDHAQDALGEIVFVELPEVGADFEAGDEIADIESVKAASEIITPVGGNVSEVNDALEDSPELINDDCYGHFIYRMNDVVVPDDLLDAKGYEDYLSTLK